MTDFSAIARSAAGQAKKPPTMPPETYPGVIKSFAWGDDNKNKTPYVRLMLGFTGWPESMPESWDEFDDEKQKSFVVERKDIDLATRQMRRDFYMTDDSKYRMDDFLKSMGINVGTEDAPRTYEETLPELIGAGVLIEVQQQLNPGTNKTYTQVGKLAPLA